MDSITVLTRAVVIWQHGYRRSSTYSRASTKSISQPTYGRIFEQKCCDFIEVIEPENGQRGTPNLRRQIRRYGNNMRVFRMEQRLAHGLTPDLDLGYGGGFEAFDQRQITRGKPRERGVERELRLRAQFVD